ncbi:sensor histidine kinase [Marinobacter sp. ATCH36]|uniref:sensor histidine kinase n=1 Tax=Marinobacter sp. ATCH36 TaxID=2945106 RepID=UPI002021A70C|nr:sensor histidine kinase [Marinobacter sp. ATCH36]MCL7943831.1 ATP-binding protein [Marinobacter sp. ATCH36]
MSGGLRFPLFWRIFVFIWLAMALTMVVGSLVTYTLKDRERQAIERQAGLQELAMEALAVRENQGRGDAWRFLKEKGSDLDLHLFLIEADHNDGSLPESIRERMESVGWYRQRPAVIEVAEGYRLVAWPRLNGEAWLNPRVYQWVELALAFVIITLACAWVARLVSRPLRQMELTARAIAGGDNSLRVGDRITRRRDEVGALATAFNAMTEQLCGLLDRQTHLLRDISHDLRTPLMRQRVAIELASEGGLDEDLMASILRQNERLEAMTSQILTLYRVSEQGEDIEREAVQPIRVINEVLQDAADYAEHRGVDCHLTVGPECRNASVLGDKGLLQRAFDNVVQNALDHTPPGKDVHIVLRGEQRHLLLEIRDEGPGVPDEVLPHLFEPFYRADRSRGGKGWGLGLAITRDIVAIHDGQIEAFNAEPGGLVVLLRFPIFTGEN